jgi:hypothetical protein
MELVREIGINLIAYIRTNQAVARELHVALQHVNTSAMQSTLVRSSRTSEYYHTQGLCSVGLANAGTCIMK